MKKLLRSYSRYRWYIGSMVFFFLVFALLQVINGRFWLHDFQVYYDAAKNFFSGNSVYGIPYGLSSGYYKYSPVALYLFFPLIFLDYDIARAIYFAILSILIMIAVIAADRMVREHLFINRRVESSLPVLFLTTVAFLQHIYYELHLGNINVLLLLLGLSSLSHLLKNEEKAAGLLLSVTMLIKPHFIILLPLLLVRRRFVAVISCIAGFTAGLILPVLTVGFSNNFELLKQWKGAIMSHNRSLISGQDTLYSWVYRITGSQVSEAGVNFLVLAVLVVVALAILLLVIMNHRKERTVKYTRSLIREHLVFEYLLLVALIPNLTITDSEHFMFAVPIIAWVLNYHFVFKSGYFHVFITILILFLYGGNLRELIGADLSKWMTAQGILGLGNFLLILYSIYLMKVKPQIPEHKTV